MDKAKLETVDAPKTTKKKEAAGDKMEVDEVA